MIRPYLRVLPAALGNRLDEAVLVAEQLGWELDDEQKLALGDITSTTGDGKLAFYEAVISAPRQAGKSLVCEVWAVMHAQRGERILYTGHRADLAGTIFRRMWATIPAEWGATPTFSNGRESLQFSSGGGIDFKTRGARIARGQTYDKIVVDEAQQVTEEDLDGMRYSIRTRPDAAILYAACAPNGRVNVNCLVLKSLRDRARGGQADGLVYVEWAGIELDDDGEEFQAHQMSEAVLADRSVWKRATPGFGARITEERMASELESMGPVSFAIEALNIPLWPDLAYAGAGPVTFAAFEALLDEQSKLNPDESIHPVVVSYDMNPTRTGSITLAGRRDDLLHVDLVGRFEGAAAMEAAIARLCERADLDVVAVVCDGSPENLALLKKLRYDYVVTERQAREEGAARLGQQACGSLVDFVNEGRFRHRGQLELMEAVRGAVTKSLGTDGWVYSRGRSRSDVSPLIAMACALHVADMELEGAGASAIDIY